MVFIESYLKYSLFFKSHISQCDVKLISAVSDIGTTNKHRKTEMLKIKYTTDFEVWCSDGSEQFWKTHQGMIVHICTCLSDGDCS